MADASVDLKFMLLNAENLFLLSDQKLTSEHLNLTENSWQKLSTSVFDNKPIKKCRALAEIIQEVNPDVLMLCEVGGLESLENFNNLFLNGSFSPALIEGNSDRNIDVGFLIRKGLGFYFDLVSNKNRLINFLYAHERGLAQNPITSHKFSRDVAELHFFRDTRDKPFFITLLTHLKSHLDPDGVDPHGFERRQAELRALLDIYEEHEKKHQNQVPLLLAGDFNGHAGAEATSQEFLDIYKRTQLKDVCNLAGMKAEDAYTYHQISRSGKPEGKQIDFCFLSPVLQSRLKKESCQVYRYKDGSGLPLDPPTTLEAKLQLPSDHYPLIFELSGIPLK